VGGTAEFAGVGDSVRVHEILTAFGDFRSSARRQAQPRDDANRGYRHRSAEGSAVPCGVRLRGTLADSNDVLRTAPALPLDCLAPNTYGALELVLRGDALRGGELYVLLAAQFQRRRRPAA
jgi:hypothetical protein